ncbi:MFS transporter [Trinickia sp. LjRoot230]|uniref:MFS transporter n=1 Tax=Trinickia sp. LjRoot230 TaxID=3342288 RepID=UPI003ED17095
MKSRKTDRSNTLPRLLISETLNTVSSAITLTAIPLLAMTTLDAGPLEVGVLAAAGSAAPLLLGLSAGALADRVDKRRALAVCGSMRLLLLLSLCTAVYLGQASMPLLCVAAFGLSAVKLAFDSTVMSLMPKIVERSDLPKANGWLEAANSIAYALGPAIAGGLMQCSPAVTAFVLSCALYFLGTMSLTGLRLPSGPVSASRRNSHLRDIADGIRVLWRNEIQRTIALSAGLFNLFHSAFFAVLLVFLIKDLSLAPSVFGATMSCVGVVGLLAAFCGPKLVSRLDVRVTLAGTLLVVGPLGIPIIFAGSLALPYQVATIALCLAAWDFVIVVHIIVEQTLRQTMIAESHLGRVSATTRFISWGADPVGALAGGALAASLGTSNALMICLIGLTLSGATLLSSKGLRNLRHVGLCNFSSP